MKKVLFSILAIAGACTFFACSNGDYIANPTTAANESVNPLNLLPSDQFSWGGTDAVSAKINGAYFNADTLHASFSFDTAGYNTISAYTDDAHFHGFLLRFKDVWANGVYSFGYNNVLRMGVYSDSVDRPRAYYSFLGNVGQVYIIQNDSSRIKGKFHFQALDTIGGKVINVSEGWFNVKKY